ncbi:hypothetical protein RKE29_14615 [Streptomyces sp. B1866]|uniref:hypothetical protein n=1 Tax=Streptomyces sp. B1866 TaxID=3075431 RepID=UPI00288CB0AD|nr:hypothetical protein [Streptomyces sp. B1866]MDT3397862.1 hypothetical protein [Streptomyces sp. B1866]
MARTWTHRIDQQIADLERLKRKLVGCIGCGCLSLGACALYNPHDTAATRGPGARYLLGDDPPTDPARPAPAGPAARKARPRRKPEATTL